MGSKKKEIAEIKHESIRKEEQEPEFLQDFFIEAREHLENIEMDSLTLETDPENTEIIHSMFRAFHSIKGLAGFVEQDTIQRIAHQTETLLDWCRKGKLKISRIIINLVLNSCDTIRKLCDYKELKVDKDFLETVEKHVQELANVEFDKDKDRNGNSTNKRNVKDNERHRKLGEILVDQGKVSKEDIDKLLLKQKEEYPDLKLGQIVLKEKKVEAKDIVESIRTQQGVKESGKKQSAYTSEEAYIRIPVQKVDSLVDMMGELLIIESLLEQDASILNDSNNKFHNNLLRMSRIIKDIQKLSMSLRMVSLKSTFQKIVRVGRDAVIELGKNVSIQTIGEETEIDRGVAEKLLDPLLHLVKNCISHGIEEEKERTKKGKSAQGRVEIKAYSKRGNVYIEVSDDGKGIDVDKVYHKALERKLIDPALNYKEDEIVNFIFMPGFSTAEKVDSISGRGVGLDVVKTEVLKIGGRIEINNLSGEGCTFVLKIPINLAVMNGTIVEIMGVNYILPTINIKEIIQPEENQWVTVRDNPCMIKVRKDVIPVIPTGDIFGTRTNGLGKLIAVLELEQKLKALPVQSIIGRREIVVKPVGSEFSHLDFISGASILGDGKVSMILDVETLFRMEN